jgi:hypothetical protein
MDVIVRSNEAVVYGGGMTNTGSSPILMGVTFDGNTANRGAGIANAFDGNPTLTNVTLNGNVATEFGGGIYNYASSPTLTNVTMSGNTATSNGGGMFNTEDSDPSIINSIFYGNSGGEIFSEINSTPVVTYSIIQNGYAGTGNLDVDPLLGPLADNGGFTQTMALMPSSPAIDAGDDVICPSTDQRGMNRIKGAHCDIGAFEYDGTAPVLTAFSRHTPATSPTNADSLIFRATFNEDVTNVNAADFNVSGTTATVTAVNVVDPSTYDVTVSGGNLASLEAVVGLDLNGSQDIEDLAGNTLPSSEPTTDQTYLIDNTAPSIDAIIRAYANPTSASSVDFTVTFSEVVTGVDATDFSLATTGVVGASVTGVSGSGDTYTVSVNTGTGDGTIRLDVTDDNSIIDAASNALGGAGVGVKYYCGCRNANNGPMNLVILQY